MEEAACCPERRSHSQLTLGVSSQILCLRFNTGSPRKLKMLQMLLIYFFTVSIGRNLSRIEKLRKCQESLSENRWKTAGQVNPAPIMRQDGDENNKWNERLS